MSSGRSFKDVEESTASSRDSNQKSEVKNAAQGNPVNKNDPSARDPRLTVELPPELKERFDEAVETMGVTKKSVVKRAVEQFCEYTESQGGPDYFGS